MRMNLAELTQEQLGDTCVQMQGVIDKHVAEKQGMKSQVTALGNQVPALQNKIARLEAEADGTDPGASAMCDVLKKENTQLHERIERLQKLNEGLQEKLIG